MKLVYMAIGIVMLIIGLIGLILPIMPTVPFIFLALIFFSKGNRKFYAWIMRLKLWEHKLCRPFHKLMVRFEAE